MFPDNMPLFLAAENSVTALGSGGYKKQILVLVSKLSEGDRVFVSRVLAAAELDTGEDTLYVEVPGDMAVNCFSGLPSAPRFILSFGVTPAQAGCSARVSLYTPVQFNRATWLFSDAPSVLEPNRDKKTQLWSALKEIFPKH
ncbi:MAG: hypothetical protein RL013_1378 [Bacteroidota bacterium]|jgi:hypothetical protein